MCKNWGRIRFGVPCKDTSSLHLVLSTGVDLTHRYKVMDMKDHFLFLPEGEGESGSHAYVWQKISSFAQCQYRKWPKSQRSKLAVSVNNYKWGELGAILYQKSTLVSHFKECLWPNPLPFPLYVYVSMSLCFSFFLHLSVSLSICHC